MTDRRQLGRMAALVALAMATAGSLAADSVTVKEEAFVRGPKVLLGDIADVKGANEGALASIEIANAPSAGSTRILNAALINSRIAGAGLDADAVELRGSPVVRATTLAQEITPEMLAEELRLYIETEMPWDPAEALVDVELPRNGVVVPDGTLNIAWRINPNYRWVGPGTFRCEISVDGVTQKTQYCRANVDAYTGVVVAAADLGRGDRIGPRSVAIEKRPVSSVDGNVFRSIDAVLGMVADRSIFPGQVLTQRLVSPPVLFKRNDVVRIEIRRGTVHIAGRARAMDDGYAGELVTCQNLNSKDRFTGVVRADGVVEIQ